MIGKFRRFGLLVSVALLLGGCGAGGSGAGGTAGQQALINEIASRFPYLPNQPLEQIFYCQIAGSGLQWYLDFHANGTIDLYTTLNNGQDIFDTGGTYTHQNNQLAINMVNSAVNLPNEISNRIEIAMGMIARFTTSALNCYTYGHRYNLNEFASVAHFQCPVSNIHAVSQDENAIEFVHAAMPFAVSVPGSAFRQRDRHISGSINPIIRRGYGIYRRDGNRVYSWFGFNQFDDYAYLSGQLVNSDTRLTLDQAEVAGSACSRS